MNKHRERERERQRQKDRWTETERTPYSGFGSSSLILTSMLKVKKKIEKGKKKIDKGRIDGKKNVTISNLLKEQCYNAL